MANEIAVSAPSGQTLYVLLRNATGQVYNAGSLLFETYSAGSYASYALALVEQGATGYFVGSVPAPVSTSGRYSLQAKQQAGGAPAPSDQTVAAGALLWNGATEVDVLASQDKSGYRLDLGQAVPTSNTAHSVGDALCAARAQGFGAWRVAGTTLQLLAPDGTTVVRAFTLDNALSPTSRT